MCIILNDTLKVSFVKIKMSTLIFLSYNLDCQSKHYEDRLKNFLILIKTYSDRINVLALQNVYISSYEKLGREMGYIGYKKVLPENFQSRNIGELFFIKTSYTVSSSYFLEFQKNTERKGIFIISIDNIISNEKLWFGTTQLDSLAYLQTYQLERMNKMIDNVIPKDDNIIIGLDTKSLEYNNINTIEGWYDSWYEAGSDKEKYTLDYTVNRLTPQPFKDRPDRVWYRQGSKFKIDCEESNLFGHKCDLPISSHFGVLTHFKINV